MPSYEPGAIPIVKPLLLKTKWSKNSLNERVHLQKLQKAPEQGIIFIDWTDIYWLLLSVNTRHYSRYWVLSNNQHREPAQSSELWLLGSLSPGPNIFLLRVFCHTPCISNIILAVILQSEDQVRNFRQNILLLNNMKEMESTEFYL